MTATATRLRRSEARHDSGCVKAIEQGNFVVDIDSAQIRALRAKSCLVTPNVGDTVWIATTSSGEAYLLAVLNSADAALSLDVNGRFSVAATEGIELVSPKKTSITTSELHVDVKLARVAFDALIAIGASLRAEISCVRIVVESIERVAERVVDCVRESTRIVAGLDHVHAEQIDHVADATLSLRAKHAVVSAEVLAKIDGDQVHIG